jgi:hypothetical protein
MGDQGPPSEHDQLAHLVEVEIPRLQAERDEAVAKLAEAQDLLRHMVGDYDRRRSSRWGRVLLWLLRRTT